MMKRKAAALTGDEKIVDAYCGVGTIGLWLANDAAEVRGMDVIPEAIADARKMRSVTDLQIRNMKQVKLNNGYRNG